jgi:formylglycine-generating enzyme required for sulfatase activity/CRP-like cAMP-binding protein
MGVVPSQNNRQMLKKLVPLNLLSDEDLEQLLQTASFNKDNAGTYLFRQGDTDYHNVYLISGQVALLDKMREVDRITAGSEMARFPLAHQIPRKNSARAIGRVEYVCIDNRKLSELLVRSNEDDYKVADLNVNSTDDWMAQLLQSNVFQQIPAANIQGVIMRMEEVEVKRGENVIKQGGEGDYFYLIHQGQCAVLRKAEGEKEPVELAKLGPGDSFGEEALLSDSPRNSTVCMLTKGVLLRLAKEDFIEFVKRPLAIGVSYDEAVSQVNSGAVWLDVRSPEVYAIGHIGNSVSLPLDTLRYQARNLATDQRYVICCDDGQLSATAAFLLTDRGYSVSVLEGGLISAPKEILVKEETKGTETSAKVINLHSGEEMVEDAGPGQGAKELDDLREKLTAANNRIKDLGARFQSYRDKQQKEEAQRQAELKAQKAILDKTRNRLEELRVKRNVDRLAAEQMEQGSEATNESLAAAVEELNQTKNSVAEYAAKLQAEQGKNRTIFEQRDDLQRQMDKVLQEQQQLSQSEKEQKELGEGLRQEAEEKVAQLQQSHEQQLGVLQEELGTSRGRVEEVVAEREALAKSIEKLRARQEGMEQSDTAFSDMEGQLAQIRAELDASKNKYEGTSSELEQVKQALQNAEAGLGEAQNSRQQAETELKELQEAQQHAQADFGETEEARRRAEEELQQERTAHQQAETELKELQEAQQHAQADFGETEEARRRAEEELQQERTARQRAETELERRTATAPDDVPGEVKELKDEIDSLTESLKEADFAYDEIREKAELLSEEKERTLELMRELEGNGAAAREEIAALTLQLEQLRSNHRQLESTLSETGAGSEEAEALREELNLVQMHSSMEIQELKNELNKLREEATTGLEKAEEEALRQELDEIRESSKKREERLTEADSKCRSLEDFIEDRDKRIDQLNLEFVELRAKYEEVENSRQGYQEKLNQLRDRVERGDTTNEYVDSRFEGNSRALNLDEAIHGPSSRQAIVLWFLLGVVICFALLDGLMLISGRGELISSLLQGQGTSEVKPGAIDRSRFTPGSFSRTAPGGVATATRQVAPGQITASEAEGSDSEPDPPWSMLTDVSFGPAMIRLRGGSFIMGSNRNQVSGNEWPAHEVELKDFAISQVEVTFEEYDRFAQATGRRLPEDDGWGRGKRPVIHVGWDDAVAYTEWLSERTGKKYRLPTEAEWEFAIRSGSDATYWWGYQMEEGRANCFDCGSQWDRISTAQVGSFPPNNYGLHDLAGNVREWVLDCYHPSHSGAPTDGSAWMEAGCDGRVVRGGAYNKTSDSMRSTWRGRFKPGSRLSVIGFRVVREL